MPIAISPDGHFVYVAGGTADSLLTFSRDAATGRLTQLAGTAGCLRNGRSDCAPVTGLDAPVGDRGRSGRHDALRRFGRGHADGVPARRDDRAF